MTRAALAGAVLPVLVLSASAAVDRHGATPGAAGIGDPYYPLDGNGGYDVAHYDLDLRYDPDSDELSGRAAVESVAGQALSSFDLDLHGLQVHSVTVDGRAASWSRAADELVVQPARPLARGQRFTTVVRYSGVPETVHDEFGSSGFVHTGDGAVVAGQPEGAATWFPCDDHPRDAASVTVTATVPAGLTAVSNGVLAGQRTSDGWTSWRWEAAEPMAPYLVTLDVGDVELSAREVDGIRYWDAIDPGLGRDRVDVARAALDRQPEMIALLAEWFGRYPFGAAGGIVDQGPDFDQALETQTRPVYGPGDFTDRQDAETVVVHELAHQWTGDLVRLARWQDIWLNEGFATYAEWLWGEHEGRATVGERAAQVADDPGSGVWDGVPGDPGPRTEDLFGDAVYDRGALTLQALRVQVGDPAFRDIVRTWTSRYAGRAVTTADFVALAEEVSGQQLDGLFDTWLYTSGRPALPG
jgi:aminopeptidase N